MTVALKNEATIVRELTKSIQLKRLSQRASLSEEEIVNFQKHLPILTKSLWIDDYRWLTSYRDERVRAAISHSDSAVGFLKVSDRKVIIKIAEDTLHSVRIGLSKMEFLPADVRNYAAGDESCRERAIAWAQY